MVSKMKLNLGNFKFSSNIFLKTSTLIYTSDEKC